MIESPRLEEENIIKDVRNLFRLNKLKQKQNAAAVKGIRNLFRLEIQNKAIKDRMIRDIRNLFEHEEEDYYKPVTAGNFWSNNHDEYESKNYRKTVSVEEYFNKIRPYL